ncbi:DHS-like NAD/FAD-binding domain-containing protein [Delitschia confertaspora ATCC 74209]|uniref:DHS-like NAD/FAD-binding domain-containing protein n=1 Tax=Delitschia confertaspora ATCC 74209 TaxID=1513339 RepID=A0A9P4JF11_9PLEO|nr:DHS-like NAD/FAD-binding domain-containing protein [Delitschia confertaspora ATCC 74209]
MSYDGYSDRASSPLSSVPSMLSQSPSPPPELRSFSFPSYPSPSISQRSSAKTSPNPENMAPTPPPLSHENGTPPRKKRKLDPKSDLKSDPNDHKPERLDLSLGEVDPNEQAQLDRLLKVLHKRKKIVVVAGAGISVSAGIPDFRSSTGLFKSLRKEHNLKSSGKDLFDASVYQDDSSTSSFHDMVRTLSEKTKTAQPTAFHHLLATLAHEGRLLRLYTQNVDGIDTALPPLQTQIPLPKKGPWPKTIQLHGGLDKMVCTKCHMLAEFDADIFNGPVPPACASCEETDAVRQVAEKRSHGIGRLRPRMVLYNEHNPDDEAIGSVSIADVRARPDAVIVVGTTLKVPGVRRVVKEMCKVVRDRRDGVAVWINNDPEPTGKDFSWDLVVQGPCDEVARHAAMRRWDDSTEYKQVSTEEISKISAGNKAKVVVPSPRKPKAVEHIHDQLITPAASPRMAPRQTNQPAPKPEPVTPSKSAGRKRKSDVTSLEEGSSRVKASKAAPKKPRQTKKPAPKKGKGKENVEKITNKFQVSKQTIQLRSLKEKDTISVNSTTNIEKQTRVIEYHPKPMAPVPPQAVRNNTSSPQGPPTTINSRCSSPLSSPPPELRKLEFGPSNDSRPSSSSSRRHSGTITPTGRLPNYSHVLIDT